MKPGDVFLAGIHKAPGQELLVFLSSLRLNKNLVYVTTVEYGLQLFHDVAHKVIK